MRRQQAAIIAAGAIVVTAATTGVALAAAGGAAGGERPAEVSFTEAHRSAAATTEGQAVGTAMARHAGRATDVHLEDEGDGLRWEVKPTDGSHLWEVQVDARSGAVASDRPEELR